MPFKQVIGIILILVLFILGADTKIDLQSRTKNPNFSGMTGTFPFQTGTALPATCSAGQSYFRTNVSAGLNLFSCTSTNTWTCMSCGSGGGGGGLITWQTEGSQTALEQVANFKSGTGILLTGTNPSGKYQLQVDYDPATLPSLDGIQSGVVLYVRSTSGNDTYVGCPTHPITSYTRGMFVVLDGDTANTGTATINLCTLGAKSILNRAGGALNDGDITANKPIFLGYDGTQFDILGDGGGASLTAAEPLAISANQIQYAFRPQTLYLIDEFPAGYGFGAGAPHGQLGWQSFTDAGNCAVPFSHNTLPGLLKLPTGTANNNYCGIALDASLSSISANMLAPGTATWHNQILIFTDSAVTSYQIEVGWTSAQGYRATNTIAVRFDTTAASCNSGSNSTTDFILDTISGGTSTCTALGATVVANTAYLIDISGVGGVITAKYSTNNGATFSSPVTSSTNVSSAGMFPQVMVLTHTTATRLLYIDRWELLVTGLTRP